MHLPGSFIKDTGYSRTHLCGFYCLSSGINGNITDPLAVGIIVKIIIIIIIPRQGFAAIEKSITETASSVICTPSVILRITQGWQTLSLAGLWSQAMTFFG